MKKSIVCLNRLSPYSLFYFPTKYKKFPTIFPTSSVKNIKNHIVIDPSKLLIIVAFKY